MCQLLSLNFSKPVNSNFSYKGFRHRGASNPDGYGFAYYSDNAAQVIKQPIRADKSALSNFIENYPGFKSRIFLAHVRNASCGTVALKNTHPFSREDYTFMHNGTLRNYSNLELGRHKPVGDTDSEYVFCHLLDCIEKEKIHSWKIHNFQWLHQKLHQLNNYGSLNCIFSDGKFLFSYRDRNYHTGLYFTQRKAPFEYVCLADENFEVNLSEEKDASQKGFIICTEPLTDEHWEEFLPGELIIFRNGSMVFSSEVRNNIGGFYD